MADYSNRKANQPVKQVVDNIQSTEYQNRGNDTKTESTDTPITCHFANNR